jgi:adenosylhomocysteine nucleosidase
MSQPVHEKSLDGLDLLSSKTLFVFALDSEAADEFHDVNKVIVGVGKINAAYELTKAIHHHKPELIVNLGSAGSNVFKRGEVICCTQFLQRDMDVRGLGFQQYQVPFSDIPPVLNYGLKIKGLPDGICGTGDSFETNHFSADYNVIDMEAYSFAYVAMKENLQFLCLKYISDGADGMAAEDWNVQVHNAAVAFKKILF